MPRFPELEPLLERLARAQVAHEQATAALSAAARRLASSPGGDAGLRAMAVCEVQERRARLHVELARRALEQRRIELLDDQRRVPAAFRRRRSNGSGSSSNGTHAARAVEVLGAPVGISPRGAAGRATPS